MIVLILMITLMMLKSELWLKVYMKNIDNYHNSERLRLILWRGQYIRKDKLFMIVQNVVQKLDNINTT